ncbi:MAG TPA: N-acetylmuramoyl-L-alanine amidase [Candidatus Limnocylindria bacterium]|nr:N-acetylmuramoyl-L-alanine amidase [Candidatus Limnocylindria bacterium]
MASINETKAQLLRGAVQDNVDVARGVRRKRPLRQDGRLRHWMLSVLLVVGTAYLIMPGHVTSRGNVPGATVAPVGQDAATAVEQALVPEAVLPDPRPLDLATIPLSIKRIVIDPGHGGEPGTTSESGLTEKELTLDIALRLRRLMANGPYEILLTRDTDRYMSLDKRVAFANNNKADLFVSIHANWMEPRTIRALETYYVGPTDDPDTLKLASIENKDSGYSLSDYKKILEKIYVDERRDESRALAGSIQGQLYRSLKPANPKLKNRGVRTAPFVVLIGTQMPAILVEISCLSNEDEVELLTKEDYRENIALALMQGLQSYASNLNATARKGN